MAPRRNVGRDHVDELPRVEGFIIHIDPNHESQNQFTIDDNYIHIVPRDVIIEFLGQQSNITELQNVLRFALQ